MQVSVESTGGLERKMTIQVPADEIESAVSRKLADLTSKVRIDGFRPGKVPLKVVKQHYDRHVRQQVLEEVIQKSLNEAMVEKNIRMAGSAPRIEPVNMKPGETFEFCATFEIYPEIALSSLEGSEVEKQVAEVEDKDVDKLLEKLQVQRVTWNQVEREAAEEDQLLIDFEGRIDGETFDGGSAKDTPLVLGSNTMVEGFEQQLLGAKAGETRTVEVTFPENYANQEVAGKQASFEVLIKTVSEPHLPELNADFVKSFGVASGDLEDLKRDIRTNMERELEDKIRSNLKNKVFDILLDKNDIEIPKALVDEDIKVLAQRYTLDLEGTLTEEVYEKLQEIARQRVKIGLLVAEVVQANKLEPSSEKIDEILNREASSYDDPEQLIQTYRQNEQMMKSIASLALEEQVIDTLLQQMTVKEIPVTFDEMMESAQ